MLLVVMMALLVVACDGEASVDARVEQEDSLSDQNTENENVDVDKDADGKTTVKADVDADLDADVEVTVDDTAGAITDVVVEMNKTDEVQDAIANAEEFCVPGQTYTYASAEGSVDSNIIGLTTYKGMQMCEATSLNTIESPMGTITTDTTYYFDDTYSEFWVVTTVSGDGMPSQTTEIHLIDGEVVN